MSEHVSVFLARRIREEFGITGPLTLEQLVAICRQRDCAVARDPRLRGAGYHITTPEGRLIALSSRSGAEVLAHELYHHLVQDNEEHGITYSFPDFCEVDAEPDGEGAAHHFAQLLCHPDRAPGPGPSQSAQQQVNP